MQKRSVLLVTVFIFLVAGLMSMPLWTPPVHGSAGETSVTPFEGTLKNGDIIFHISTSSQSNAIQLATHSTYSHCGIIYEENGSLYVYEAVGPVKKTPLAAWIARGKNKHYVVKRLKNADTFLTPETIKKMKEEGEKMNKKAYDTLFEWSDEKIYCSELVWKIYQRATGMEIGQRQRLRDLDLSNKTVKKLLEKRYHGQIPLDEWVISPASIFDSAILVTVRTN